MLIGGENMNLHQEGSDLSSSVQLVSFRVGNEQYGIHIRQVQEIIRMPEITQLPQTDDFIKGIINLRGNIIPIIDMRTRFNMEENEYSELTRVIVLSLDEKFIGIVVDSVSKVLELPDGAIEDAPDIINGLSKEYIEGVGKIDENMIIILKAEKVLTADEIKKLEKTTKKAVKAHKKKSKSEVN
jgi:purine-binding chemotaxis protein CheW